MGQTPYTATQKKAKVIEKYCKRQKDSKRSEVCLVNDEKNNEAKSGH